RVKAFQKKHQLVVNGIGDPVTLKKLEAEVPYLALEEGVRHNDMLTLKKHLQTLAFANGMAMTNYYGSYTTKKVKDLQKYYGIKQTGKADKDTLKIIKDILNSPYLPGKRHQDIIPFKEKLNATEFGGISLTNLYGSFTEKRVKAFQKKHQLVVNGIGDPVTLKKLEAEVPYLALEEGVRHNDVLTLKKDLQTLGFANGMSMTNYYGSYTTKKVKDLQKYYGIKQTGKADKDTLKIIKDILNSPYLPGKRHQDIIPFKEKLNATEFGGISLTNLYGSFTEKRVKAFQKKHQLVVNGIGDPVTLKKLEAEVPYLALEEGVRHNDVLTLKKDLQTLGFANGMSMTNYYGSYTTKKVKDLQKYYGIKQTGKADKDTLKIIKDILNSPYLPGKRHQDIIPFKEKLNATEFGGISLTNLYGSFTEKRVKAFQKKHQLVVNGIGDPVTLKKLEAEVPYLALEEGVRHNDVLTLKKDLQTLGFANGMSMTNYYGSYTTKKVKDLQKYYGIKQTGKADKDTLK